MYLGDEDCQLFIGDLNDGVDEQLLYREFAPFGGIVNLKIMRHIVTKKSRGMAFITYKSHKQAVLAKEKMNGAAIMGSRIRVMLKGENKALNREKMVQITNIDPTAKYEDLEALCKKYPSFICLKYGPDSKDSFTNRASAFFDNIEDAERCVADLNGLKFLEKIVTANLNNKVSKLVVIKGELSGRAEVIKSNIQTYCSRFGTVENLNLTEASEGNRFVCFVEFDNKSAADKCLSAIADPSELPAEVRGFAFESYKDHPSHHFHGQGKSGQGQTGTSSGTGGSPGRTYIVTLKPVQAEMTTEVLSALLKEKYGLTGVQTELSKIASDHNKDGWQLVKLIFDSSKSLNAFSTEHEKQPSALDELAPKGMKLNVQYPYHYIESAMKRNFNSKMNRLGQQGTDAQTSQTGYQSQQGDQSAGGRGYHRGGDHQRGGNYHRGGDSQSGRGHQRGGNDYRGGRHTENGEGRQPYGTRDNKYGNTHAVANGTIMNQQADNVMNMMTQMLQFQQNQYNQLRQPGSAPQMPQMAQMMGMNPMMSNSNMMMSPAQMQAQLQIQEQNLIMQIQQKMANPAFPAAQKKSLMMSYLTPKVVQFLPAHQQHQLPVIMDTLTNTENFSDVEQAGMLANPYELQQQLSRVMQSVEESLQSSQK